jgi:3-oxoacyl-[acyl-carrier protein] reductase
VGVEVSLDGKVALVTGAGPNIGSGIALALARYGAKVACNDISQEAADASARRIERHGGEAMAVTGDVSDEADVRRYVGEVLDAYGRIDILVNNAALLGGRGLLEESLEFFNRAVTVAGAGCFLNSQVVATSMIERGIRGSIVCILSSNAWQGAPGVIAYAFHKGGVANFVRAAAMDLAPYGIRVNSFSPTAPEPDNPARRRRRLTSATAWPGWPPTRRG